MSFDPFETRLQFLQLIRKLNATQPSIQKVVSFALKYGSRCGEDLWECIVEECGKGSLNTRINILYFLDSLLEASQSLNTSDGPYIGYTNRDLISIVKGVVPDTREGILNYKSAKQILESWRLRRLVDHDIVEEAIEVLSSMKHEGSSRKRNHDEVFSRNDILRRMEEDRERHKRLRERIWILPFPPLIPTSKTLKKTSLPSRTNSLSFSKTQSQLQQSPTYTSPTTPASPSGKKPSRPIDQSGVGEGNMPPPPVPNKDKDKSSTDGRESKGENGESRMNDPLEAEFELMWELTTDLDEEDLRSMKSDALLAQYFSVIPP